MTDTSPAYPLRPSKTAMTRGLGVRAMAEFERMAAELKAAGSPEAAAAACKVKLINYERRFRELATAAGWASKTPADYLAGRETAERRGGRRHGEVSRSEGVHAGGLVTPETHELVGQAREKLGLSWERFARGAAEHILAGGSFLTLDSQNVQA